MEIVERSTNPLQLQRFRHRLLSQKERSGPGSPVSEGRIGGMNAA